MHVGSALSTLVLDGAQRDDEGDNISSKNPRYCELTALYWLWKNDDATYKGIVHYRRHFAGNGEKGVASAQDIEQLLEKAPIILPKKRRYYISTIEKHYADTFEQAHIDILREVLSEKAPDVLDAFNAHMHKRSAHIWNMVIMRSDIYDDWCAWLFPILEETEKRIDFTGMTPFEERVMGRLSERLLDPWVASKGLPFTECRACSLEPINWRKKVLSFLEAKFAKKKYSSSF